MAGFCGMCGWSPTLARGESGLSCQVRPGTSRHDTGEEAQDLTIFNWQAAPLLHFLQPAATLHHGLSSKERPTRPAAPFSPSYNYNYNPSQVCCPLPAKVLRISPLLNPPHPPAPAVPRHIIALLETLELLHSSSIWVA